MAITKRAFGVMPSGETVYKYTLTNHHGVSADFITLGGTWVTMNVPDKKGKMADVILGYDNLEGYLSNNPHFGAIIGRNANRIGGAVITIDGKDYKLEANNGPNNLHSAPDLYHRRLWDCEAAETDEGSCLTFSLKSPDGDQGYPGNASIQVSYTLTEDDSIRIHYHMICDADTIANFTNHCYFNLAGYDGGSVMDQEVWLAASKFTPADEVSIPTGEILKVEGTPMDFRTPHTLGERIDEKHTQIVNGAGYDHCYVLNKTESGELSLAATCIEPHSGRTMEVYTTENGVQLYTGNWLGGFEGAHGATFPARSAVCFEAQCFPDTPNKSHFPSAVLLPGDEYQQVTIYKFGVQE